MDFTGDPTYRGMAIARLDRAGLFRALRLDGFAGYLTLENEGAPSDHLAEVVKCLKTARGT